MLPARRVQSGGRVTEKPPRRRESSINISACVTSVQRRRRPLRKLTRRLGRSRLRSPRQEVECDRKGSECSSVAHLAWCARMCVIVAVTELFYQCECMVTSRPAFHRRMASPTIVALQPTMQNEDVIAADSSATPALPTFKRKKRPQAVRSSLLRGDTPGDASDSSAREQTPLSGFEGDAEDSTRCARLAPRLDLRTTRDRMLNRNCHLFAARHSRNCWRSVASNGAPLGLNSIA